MDDSPGAGALPDVTAALVEEFAGSRTPAGVAECVDSCRGRLVAAGVHEDLAGRTRALAAAMLRHPASAGRWSVPAPPSPAGERSPHLAGASGALG
jgi:hypothetical protein